MKRNAKNYEVYFSKRELEIMKLISNGFASKQIADNLNISKLTVDTHRKNLIKKAGVRNTIELSVKLSKLGLI
jgi:DNA-binding NarL/FixJ family response regulator